MPGLLQVRRLFLWGLLRLLHWCRLLLRLLRWKVLWWPLWRLQVLQVLC